MNRKSYPEVEQRASLKEVMRQPPMTPKAYRNALDKRISARRAIEDMRLAKSLQID
ncbi:hypothetical protein [Noviherbaspirillum malthae]|jgi:hypothetical protein|uniref:hypothetical protein n=1 Tax=Noviherbaspirillum malthae TaxID=1260987 RepID=UPI00188E64C2|nr:hypothetical protein [Noviherbaspirillum malthae]